MNLEQKLLRDFPKPRLALPEVYQRIYTEHYILNRAGNSPATSLAQRMESWMHRRVADDITRRVGDYRTLEIGAGNLNHLDYELTSRPYDIVEPFEELYANSANRQRVSRVFHDLGEIQDGRYDRIISIATFEHLCDLPRAVAICGTLLAPDGQLRVAVPSEGTLLWGLGWRLTTGIEFRLRHGLNYGLLMRHEHVNTSREIRDVLGFFFRSIRRAVFGVCGALSFYQFFECTRPDVPRCANFLKRL
jgi:hypothetical protein